MSGGFFYLKTISGGGKESEVPIYTEEFKEKAETIKEANIDKVPNYKNITVAEVCKELGWQK